MSYAPPMRVVSLLSGGRMYEELRAAGIPVSDLGMTRGMPSLAAILKLARLINDPAVEAANRTAYERFLAAQPILIGVEQAR